MDQHNFGGPPGLSNDHQPLIPPFHAGGDGGLHMLGGHNGGPPGGPSPPMQTPMLGGPLGSGIDGMMDLQQVGEIFLNLICKDAVKSSFIFHNTITHAFYVLPSPNIIYCSNQDEDDVDQAFEISSQKLRALFLVEPNCFVIYLSYMSTTCAYVPILCLERRCLWFSFSLSKGQSCRYIGSPKGDKNLPLILIDVKTPHPPLPKSLLRTIEKLLKATNSTPFFFLERKSISLVLFLLVQTICHLDTCRHTEEFSRARESHLSFALCRHSSAFA